MKYIGLDDGLCIDKQVSNFNQLLARGANAIALYPLAPNALRASLAKAKQARRRRDRVQRHVHEERQGSRLRRADLGGP